MKHTLENVDFALVIKKTGQVFWINKVLLFDLVPLKDDVWGFKLDCSYEELLFVWDFIQLYHNPHLKTQNYSNLFRPNLNYNTYVHLLKISAALGCFKLYKIITGYLRNHLTLETCGNLWKIAVELGENSLQEYVEEYLVCIYKKQESSEFWNILPTDLKKKVCSKNGLGKIQEHTFCSTQFGNFKKQRTESKKNTFNPTKKQINSDSFWNCKIEKRNVNKLISKKKLVSYYSSLNLLKLRQNQQSFSKNHIKHQNLIEKLNFSTVSQLSPINDIPFLLADHQFGSETNFEKSKTLNHKKFLMEMFSHSSSAFSDYSENSIEHLNQESATMSSDVNGKEPLEILYDSKSEEKQTIQNEYFFYPETNWRRNTLKESMEIKTDENIVKNETSNSLVSREGEEEEMIEFLDNFDFEQFSQSESDLSSITSENSSMETFLDTPLKEFYQETAIQIETPNDLSLDSLEPTSLIF
eukprot:gb/GECH01006884.1/.p1 GENE.gb/GECH01006884.1/~~gb/GECH01006884.1/.p1  ORF type:complete len:469 (+),score=116.53 gb/GECH01006884.1/:1-1407(+)